MYVWPNFKMWDINMFGKKTVCCMCIWCATVTSVVLKTRYWHLFNGVNKHNAGYDTNLHIPSSPIFIGTLQECLVGKRSLVHLNVWKCMQAVAKLFQIQIYYKPSPPRYISCAYLCYHCLENKIWVIIQIMIDIR